MIIIIDHHDHRPDHVMLEPGPLDNSNKVSDGARKGHRGPKIHTLEHLIYFNLTLFYFISDGARKGH